MAKQQKVENWCYPFKLKSGLEPTHPQQYHDALALSDSGGYPLGSNGLWHGGIHFNDATAALLDQSAVRCIADGEVVAYRIDSRYPTTRDARHRDCPYSTGFVLVRHRLEMPRPPAPRMSVRPGAVNSSPIPSPQPELIFYSLYMHLADWRTYDADDAPEPPHFISRVEHEVVRVTDDFLGLNVRGGTPGSPGFSEKLAVLPHQDKYEDRVNPNRNASRK